MSSVWIPNKLRMEIERAYAKARKYVKLQPILFDPPPHQISFDIDYCIPLNPVVVGYKYVPKSVCPAWLKRYIEGRSYQTAEETETINGEKLQQAQAYNVIETAIIRRGGYNGWLQGELPF